MIAAGVRQEEVLCVTCHSGSSVAQCYLLFYLWQDVEKTFQELLSTIYSQSVGMTWTSNCEGTHSPDTRAQLWQETVWLSGEQCEHSPHSMERCAIMSLLSDKQEMKAFHAAFTVQKVIYPGGRSACCQRRLLIDPVGSKRVVTSTTLLTPEYLPSIIKYSWSQLRRCVPAYRRVSGLMMPSWGRHCLLAASC